MIVLLALLASSVGFHLSLGAGTQWWAAWLAPLPLLALARTGAIRKRTLFALGALAFAAGLGNLVPIYVGVLPVPALVAAIAPPALAYGALVLLFRWSLPGLSGALPALLFAAAWTALEWLTALVSPHGSAGAIGYSQVVYAAAAQPARYGGVHLLSFLLCLVPAAAALLADPARRRSAAAVLLAVLALLAITNLAAPPVAESTRRIAVIASDGHPDAAFVADATQMAAVLADYRPAVAEAARQGATLAVLPERIALIPEKGEEAALASWSALATEFGIELVVGLADGAGPVRRNRTWYLDAKGERTIDYAKRHLMPGLESAFTPGERIGADGSVGIAICKDLDFDATALDFAGRDTTLLLVPAWDFGRDAELHARLARTRALEGGFTLVRSARQGLVGVYDDRGRVLAEARSGVPATVLVADVPIVAERTVFSASHGYFGMATLYLALFLAGAAMVAKALSHRRPRMLEAAPLAKASE